MSKKLLKISTIEWVNSSRDKRELSAAVEAGFDVCVIGKGDPGDHLKECQIDGFTVYKCTTRPLENLRWLVKLNRIVSLFTWASSARKLHPDVISGRNLLALLISYLSCWYLPKSKRPKLVYDSHEFELAFSTENSGRLKYNLVKCLERFLIQRSAAVIMINDSIADEVVKTYDLKKRPLVIRSTPDYWSIDPALNSEIRKSWLERLGLPSDTFLIMYHGFITERRGIETVLDAVARTESTAGIILGNYPVPEYYETLQKLCEKAEISGRVLFVPAVPLTELWKYVGAVDVGLITYHNLSLNYYYALPNKFFENIQSLTPLICSDFPEFHRLLKKYDIGLLIDPEDQDSIATAVRTLQTDKHLYKRLKYNLLAAKSDLCWEKERLPLVECYKSLAK